MDTYRLEDASRFTTKYEEQIVFSKTPTIPIVAIRNRLSMMFRVGESGQHLQDHIDIFKTIGDTVALLAAVLQFCKDGNKVH